MPNPIRSESRTDFREFAITLVVSAILGIGAVWAVASLVVIALGHPLPTMS